MSNIAQDSKVRNWLVDDMQNRDWAKLLLRLRGQKEDEVMEEEVQEVKEFTLVQRVEHGLAALGEAIKSIFEAREKENSVEGDEQEVVSLHAELEPDFLYTDAKSVLTRGEKGQFITKDGRVIFIGGPGSGGGTAGGGGGGLPAGHAEEAAANRLGIEGEVGYAGVDGATFAGVRDAAVPEDKRPFVTAYSPEEYAEMGARTYLSESGRSGYAVKPDGDIISVFSERGANEGRWAISSAISNGGSKLDCFDGFLARDFYPTFGFKEYERWTWDNQYAPKDWNFEKYDSPDVVLMRLE